MSPPLPRAEESPLMIQEIGKNVGPSFSKVPKTLRARKAIRKTPTRLFCEAGRFKCCKGNTN